MNNAPVTHGVFRDIATKLFYTTAFIQTDKGVGTSFLVSEDNQGSLDRTWLVTNRHILEGCNAARFAIHKQLGPELQIFTTPRAVWKDHPGGLDLSILSLSMLIQATGVDPKTLDFVSIPLTTVLNNEQLEATCAGIEQVTLLGYPYGLMDDVNYLPFARRGATAMPPWVDWKGRPEFYVDIAGFPGNSGGPVLLFDRGNFTDKNGTLRGGETRLHLLGVFSGRLIPRGEDVPVNLGMSIKATALRDMVAQVSGRKA